MKAALICPDPRSGVQALARKLPLAAVPLLGKPAIHHELESLASAGAKIITIYSSDRCETIRALVGTGEQWGLRVEVLDRDRELSIEEARVQGVNGALGQRFDEVRLLDRLSLVPGHDLWESYSSFLDALFLGMGKAAALQVGMREIAPEVFVGMRSKVSPTARITGPCWIGRNVRIGPDAVIGPMAVVEDHSYIDEQSAVISSIVGPSTYLGAAMNLQNSIAWGSDLIHVASGNVTELADPILLADIRPSWKGMDVFRSTILRAILKFQS
jgi:NDP-sugar pyrophosphorylase family protein